MDDFDVSIAVSRIDSGKVSDDGKTFAIRMMQPDIGEVTIAVPTDQLMPLIALAAVGHTKALSLLHDDPHWREFHKATTFELSQDNATGAVILSLTFGIGGRLSFALPQPMPAQIAKTLQKLSPPPRGVRLM
jgi:hypothetical protein